MLKSVRGYILQYKRGGGHGGWDFNAFLGIYLMLSFSFRCNSQVYRLKQNSSNSDCYVKKYKRREKLKMKSEIGFGVMLLGIALSNGIFAELSGLIVLVGFVKVVLDNLLKKKKN
jgi:hypothetical protein